ncbi:hemicentin-1-like [Chironomus tepperi]|uniref:hemicentin-1-like n=1 Tax=Chironomus tepperi TaxID=113505 RepID=UPI00391EF19C
MITSKLFGVFVLSIVSFSVLAVSSYKTEYDFDQKSLVFIFDTSGSMQDKLDEFKKGAQDIAKDFSSQDRHRIVNYILVSFSDPDVSAPFITKNVTEIIQELKNVQVVSSANFDCPENALSALAVGIDAALPNSIVYLFTDAPANDFELFENISTIIMKKQIVVNVLISDSCDQRSLEDDRYNVFTNITNLVNGLTYDFQANNFDDILKSIRKDIQSDHKMLRTFKSENGQSINIYFDIDDTVTELKITTAGKDQSYEIKNPMKSIVRPKEQFTMDGIKIMTFEYPMKGTWEFSAADDFVTISVKSDLKFDYGFSTDVVDDKSETVPQPISDVDNILSIFVEDSSGIDKLSNVSLLVAPMDLNESATEIVINLIKQNEELYVSSPFKLPKNPFKLYLEGEDRNNHKISRTISSILYEDAGPAPEVEIIAEKLEFYEKQNLELQCNVESLVPVNISWTFNGKIIESHYSIHNKMLILKIPNISHEKSGTYKCVAVNQVGNKTQQVRVEVTKIPKLILTSSSSKMIEDSSYELTCQLNGIIKGQEIEYSWIDKDGNVLQNDGHPFSFVAIAKDNNKVIKCQAICSDFTTESSITLNINYAPMFLTNNSKNAITYGSKVRLDCTTTENPSKRSVKWMFKGTNSTKAVLIDGKNSLFEIQEAFEKDEGSYECEVENELGKVNRNFTISLTPKESPKITPVKNVVVNETENAKIFCECKNCLPIANHSWTFNNSRSYEVQFGQNEKEDYFNTFIIINNTDEFDAGSFECQITNALGMDQASIEVKVQKASKVDKILVKGEHEAEINEKLNILEGDDVVIECVGSGEPPLRISWLKDNQEVSNDSMLKIINASLSDEGQYECVIENVVRAANRSVQVDVNFIPKSIRETNSEFIVVEGKEVNFPCELIGKPSPEISWYIDSKRIEGSDKYNASEDFLKFIAEPNDSGLYKCKGVNAYGSFTVDFVLKVKTFPRFLSPDEESIKAELNTQLKLSCDASGYPVPQIKFVKNNTEISNKSTLIIESVTVSDAGSYHCYADNEVGSEEKIFYVTVVQKPVITSNFDNITLYSNQTRSLTCLADGIPEPNYKWKLNNMELLSSDNFLNLDSDSKNGKISCIAENSEGTDERHFYLEVVFMPKLHSLAKELQTNITIREGDDLELLCPVEDYSVIKWTLNGSPAKVPDLKQVHKKLIIYNTKKSYSGLWTCSAYYTKNSTNFTYAVTVMSPPVVLASWNLNSTIADFDENDAEIDQKSFWKGENLVLNCTVDGYPVPNVEWRRGRNLIGRGEILSVNNLQQFHSDVYSCLAENRNGKVKKYFKVDILSGPHVEEPDKVTHNVYGNSGETVTIKCPIIGNPEPLFSWYKGKELLEDEIENFLIIDSVDLSDEGNYRCLARNKYGKHNIQFDFTLNEPVQILDAFEQEKTEKDDEFVTFSCITTGFPLPVISWILDGSSLSTTSKVKMTEVFNGTGDNFLYFDENGTSFSDPFDLNISSLNHYSKLTKLDKKSVQLDLMIKNNKDNLHMKKFFCNALNALGHDEKSVDTVYNQEPYIEDKDMPNETVHNILEHLPLQLSCMYDGYPVPEITWFKDGTQIFDNETLKIVNDGKILNIPETLAWLTGNYTCVGKNEIGTMELTYDVLILAPPRLVASPKTSDSSDEVIVPENVETIEVIRGTDVTLECSIEASPKAKIHWIKVNDFGSANGRMLLDEESSHLTVQSVEKNSIYQCYANNTVGFTQKFFFLNVYYPPEFIENDGSDEDLTVKLHHKVALECKVNGFPKPEIYWSFNSKNITEFNSARYLTSDDQVLRINYANRNSEGKFTCTSFNRFGQIQKSFNIKIDIPIQHTAWSDWSKCSEPCGTNGTEFRTRICILLDEIPSYNCTEGTLEVRKCNDFPCPINGGFSPWTDWSLCPTCYDPLYSEQPKQHRSRTCDSPEPAHGGINCLGDRAQERECGIDACPIDGGWSSWSDWSQCPSCYDSLNPVKPKQNRTRFCDSPVPAHGGLECQGNEIEEQECNIKACPINGGWSAWSSWNICPPCYYEHERVPVQTKTRKCDSPAPQHGGSKCVGTNIVKRGCKDIKLCPIDGAWSKWSDWSACSAVYGQQGTQYRVRDCNNPEPNFGGNGCIGLPQEKRSCEVAACDEDETKEAINNRQQRLILPQHKSRSIKCTKGFKLNLNSECVDIDECQECNKRKLCKDNEMCINTFGSYVCREI